MKQILFICTGNTCRSPMAASLFNRLVTRQAAGFEYEAVSAGLAAPDGCPASQNALLAMEAYPGAELSYHQARTLSKDDIDNAYLVLTMCRSHKWHILEICPEAYQKVFTLKEYVYGTVSDIKDPFGGSKAVYKSCADEIAVAVERLLKMLK